MVARHWKLIFLLTSSKCDLGEVDKAMFQEFLCQYELIYDLLTIQKCDIVEVKKALFQGAAWHFQAIIGLWYS